MNEYYNPSNAPATGSTLSSATIRAEFSAIGTAMDKMPVMAGNGDEVVTVNPGASGLTSKTSLAVVGEATTLATSKATPVDADTLPITDSAAANGLKKLSWANLKAAVRAYYDPLTATLTNKTINLANNTLSGTLAQFNDAVSDADLVSLAGAETLTNKTLTSPILSNPAITGSISGITDMGGVSLSAISQSLHSGAIVKAIVYDTTKDSDGGAWRKRTAHTSWYQEALGFTGKWLGQKTSTATAWATSGAAAGDGFQNSTDGKYYVLTGTSTASEIFRGNVREFPAVVGIVAESARVVIYDLTQPTCPMWMVFTSTAVTSAAAVNGRIMIGRSGVGVAEVNFVRDVYELDIRTTGAAYRDKISDRFIGTALGRSATYVIVNSAINDVAITVLDTAPIDAATGLPVPTIYAFTAGGVSRIAEDGTVSSTASTSVDRGWIDGAYVRVAKATGTSSLVGGWPIAKTLPTGGASAISTYLTNLAYDSNITSIPALNGFTTIQGAQGAVATASGITLLKENPTTPAKGMVAYITNTYNSGHMVGDIRGAWLADTTAETISGSGELAQSANYGVPATFDNVLSAVTNSGFVSTGGATANRVYLNLATVVGRTYSVSVKLDSSSSGNVIAYVRTLAGGTGSDVLASGVTLTLGSVITVNFIATTTTHSLLLASALTAVSYACSSISVKLAEPDRCVKNNGLIVNGSLTKTAVASGAGLVAWSGFSASNYLEQPYNSDLDFGTGDFCVMGWESLAAVTNQVIRIARGTVGGSRVGPYSAGTGTYYMSMLGAGGINSGVSQTLGWNFVAWVRESGVLKLYLNSAMVFSVANTTNLTDAGAILRVGTDNGASPTWTGPQKMALWRIGATAPSADQIAHIYRTELPLFQAGAQCTLAGSSAAVTTMAYDEDTTLLHVGTSWGRSSFKDLTRIDSEATSTGALTSLSASGGVIVTGGTSGKVYMPALLLRDELRRKAEARKALGKLPVFFDYTATASQTAFVVPKGYTVKALYKNGTLMRETTTGVYWTRSNDGFSETATLSVGASASDWISIMAVRS